MTVLEQLTTGLAGRYTIERQIGAGGMATVYLARDVKHDRHVALKVLNPELGAVVGVERFLAEIRVTANLQHPNLLPLFDSGEATPPGYSAPGSGLLFYVMPYVEGESLRARLEREKQLPIDETIRIAVAVASALDYAHRHGVIHRDLKPENILLQDGQPLLADFGIALAVANAGGNRITQTGLSLGTPQYMSPEQATGDRQIDGRTDIYSLGAIVYEMLTGEPPHTGNTAQAVIAKVLTDRPRSIRLSRDTVPEDVELAVERALAKLPADRFATPRDFIHALEGKALPLTHATSVRLRTARAAGTRWLYATVALLLAVIGALLWRSTHDGGAAPTVRFLLTPGLENGEGMSMYAFAPNGSSFAYVGRGTDAVPRLYVRALDAVRPTVLEGTEGAAWPSYSPDGEWIAFAAQGQLRKTRVTGGAPTVLTAGLSTHRGTAWLGKDIAFSANGRLLVVSSNGGTARPVGGDSGATQGSRWYLAPVSDRHVVFTNWRGFSSTSTLSLLDVQSGRVDSLGLMGFYPIGMLDGYLIYFNELRALAAVPLDIGAGKITGEPINLVSDALGDAGAGAASRNGSLVYHPRLTRSQLVIERGGQQRVVSRPAEYQYPRFSPDGKRIAVGISVPGRTDIHVLTLADSAFERITTDGRQNARPEWLPDGRVLYLSDRGTNGRLSAWAQPLDQSTPPQLLLGFPDRDIWEAVATSDGRYLVYRTGTLATADIFYRAMQGDTTEHVIASSPLADQGARVSPDGKWVTYSSVESGVSEVYVKPFPSVNARYQVSKGGGRDATWAPDSKALFYTFGPIIVRATLRTTGGFSVARIDTVVRRDVIQNSGHAVMDVRGDGLMVYPTIRDTAISAVVVTGWRRDIKLPR